MNKSNLKKFAIGARQELREKTKAQLKRLGMEEKKIEEGKDMGSQVEIYGKLYSKSSYQHLLVKYHSLGYEELVEESAYLWFNRLTALAYMELHDCFREHMIFSKGSKGEPSILDEYFQADFFQKMPLEKQEELHQLRDQNTSDSLETLYSILMEEKCEELSKIMPFLFSKKGKYADILFPSGLLMQDSVLKKLQAILLEIQEEDQSIPVEILGWLYQYYNSEKKDEVFAGLKKNQKVTKENIPAATQLFTPHWIVKYMVENSLGKLILEHIPNMESIKKDWNYYIETEIESSSEKLSIEGIKILDPAMGSGHMLTYAFDILFDVYQELGWSKKESVLSILQNNLYGLEIDDRAGQLAAFALLMKGKEKFPRLFQVLEREENFEMPVISLQESNAISKRMYTMLEECPTLQDLLKGFENAKEYGSILKIDFFGENILQEEYHKLQEKIQNQGQFSLLKNNEFLEGDLEEDLERLERIIRQYKIMIQKYDVVITNPPYMGGRGFSPKLKNYTEKNYKDSKSDLFSVFMEVCQGFTKKNRYTAMITMQSWMFLSSFETLRNHMITKTEIQTLNHLGARAFSEMAGEVVQTVSWVQKHKTPEKKGTYIRLVDYNNGEEKEREFFNKENYYQANQKDFTKIPGSPIAYWVSDRIREIFEKEKKLGEVGEAKQGLATADNNRFLRVWNETNFNKIGFGMKNSEEALKSGKKWFPCNKGGEYRKWYGNQEYVVNWEKDGYEIKNFYDSNGKLRSRPQNTEYYFKEALTWSTVSSSNCSFRYSSIGHLFETKGSNYFVKERNNLYYLFGLLNTKLINYLLKVLSPTLDYHEGPMSKLPVILLKQNLKISNLVSENITITKQEWDSRETSWDFERLSLLKGKTVKEAYDNYCNYWTEQFVQMHKNEEELNRIFIDIYGLQEEMDEKVEFSDITLIEERSIYYREHR